MKFLFAIVLSFAFFSMVYGQCSVANNCTTCYGLSQVVTGGCGWCDLAQLCFPSSAFNVSTGATTYATFNGSTFCSFVTSGTSTYVTNCTATQTSSACRDFSANPSNAANCSACIGIAGGAECGFCTLAGIPECLGVGAQGVCTAAGVGTWTSASGGTCSGNTPSPCSAQVTQNNCVSFNGVTGGCGWCNVPLAAPTGGFCLSSSVGQLACTAFGFRGTWTPTSALFTTGVAQSTTASVAQVTTAASPSSDASTLVASLFTLFIAFVLTF